MHVVPIPEPDGLAASFFRSRHRAGAVLLEVVLALVLFVSAAAILTSGLSSSLDSVDRLRVNAQAADFAVSVLSELQMGIKTLALTGPQEFDPPEEGWTWELVATPLEPESDEVTPYQRIEVIIRHDDPAVVYRLGQVLRLDTSKSGQGDQRPGIDSF
jgi:type II secretory pathway pseudopilin PulG